MGRPAAVQGRAPPRPPPLSDGPHRHQSHPPDAPHCTEGVFVVLSVTQNHRIEHMPAARPRMQVTPSDKGYRLLQELSKLTGKAPATIVRELLDEAAPALEMTLEAARTIAARPEQAQAAVARLIDLANTAIAQASLDLNTDQKPGRKPRRGQGAANTG